MAIQIKKAQKYGAKLRLALYGPSGSGKTYTALSIARDMASKRVCVIDTERGSASKYADIFDFDVIELDNYHPNNYIDAIHAVVQAKAYDVLIIDSVSHEWEGSRGALELAGRDFTNWASVTPLHNKFIDAMLSCDLHLIATMRAKEEHVMEQKEVQGKLKNVVTKKGMEPIQRKGAQYEFDVVGALGMDNVLSIEKTRCSAIKDMDVEPGHEQEFVTVVQAWLDGAPMPAKKASRERLNDLYNLGKKAKLYPNFDEFLNYAQLVLGPEVAVSVDGFTEDQACDIEADILKRQRQAQPKQDQSIAEMISKAKSRVAALDMVWDDIKRDALKASVEDSYLTLQQIATINGTITRYEQNALAPATK